ncbi:MAG: transcriptional repressor NrdR [Candidatus Aureabacteria bacterium]|nr:transcriptional repressor NrdR [Candidatus Auribacterota bacterium]
MKCPFCACLEDKVIDSRASTDGASIRRRRECLRCEKRFTTFEQIEEVPIMIIKKNGARESFSIKKIREGVIKACEKRPVSLDQIDALVCFVNESVEKMQVREVESQVIGELVMKQLQGLDEVAYVRFASVYRQFKDVSQFMRELSSLLKK